MHRLARALRVFAPGAYLRLVPLGLPVEHRTVGIEASTRLAEREHRRFAFLDRRSELADREVDLLALAVHLLAAPAPGLRLGDPGRVLRPAPRIAVVGV